MSDDPGCVDDGFGNCWSKCDRKDCGLEVVRPGKVQCWCHYVCDLCGGTITYHLDPDPRWPNVFGYFCDACGPLGGDAA